MAYLSGQGRLGLLWRVDWFLVGAALAISLLGLATMHAYGAGSDYFDKQLFWIAIALGVTLVASYIPWDFLRNTNIVVALYIGIIAALAAVFLFGVVVKGAQSRFDIGLFAIQPADPAKLILIFVLAKYFARRHVEIAHVKHILISGAYAFVLFTLVFLQPDLGSASIIFFIWFGMVLFAGISWRHLLTLLAAGAIIAVGSWMYVLQPYQKDRILTFVHPLADIHGAGYNVYQSTIAVGSGEIFGKGVGEGSQSKLRFLPEYQTDFIFAAYAEEWGFVGVVLLFGLYAIIILRILMHARSMERNTEALVATGIAIYFLAHMTVHIGMNMGLLPVTGTTTPFMSYGGSHLLTEFLALGVLVSMSAQGRFLPRAEKSEFLGPV